MADSPASRSKKKLEQDGYTVAIVERWNPHARVRQDLFGICDLLAIKKNNAGMGETICIQTTSGSNVSARIRKISDHENLPRLREAGWSVHVHGWRKVGNRWKCRIVDLS